ncbi:MAG: hypothetical protein VYB55_01185 [Bacteroidota bacterium]|nr:hypothetical protein [Bacteroidota bacterium]
MKKVLFFLIALTTFNNVSFASFPIIECKGIEVVNSENKENASSIKNTPLGNWSLALGILWFPLLFLSFISAFGGNEASALFFFVASIASFIGAIITGIVSLSSQETPKWKAYLGLGITCILLILLLGIFQF